MRNYLKFYIDGQWVEPVTAKSIDVINRRPRNRPGSSPWARRPTWTAP